MRSPSERRRDPAEMAALKAKGPPKPRAAPAWATEAAKEKIDWKIGLLFWRLRRQFPEFAMTFSEREIAGFRASLEYNQQAPKLVCAAASTTFVIRIEDDRGDMIAVAEQTQEDVDETLTARKALQMKERIPMLVSTLKSEFANGLQSQESMNSLCEAAMAVARL